jgi:hypothetical protein
MTVAGPAADPHPAKLPFWSTVGQAYAAPFADAQSLMRAARLWLLLLTPVLFFVSWLQMSMRAELLAGMRADPETAFAMGWQLRLISSLHSLIIVPAAASIAVAWHRLILNGERPADVYLRFDRVIWLYAAFLFATLLYLSAVGDLPRRLIRGGDARAMIGVLVVALNVVVVLIVGRLSLVLPAIALGRTDVGFADAWRATRGNTWRLYWGPPVCLLPLVLPRRLLTGASLTDPVAAALATTAMDLLSLLGGVVAVGFLSFAYRHFFHAGERDA